ncbi:MAG: peptidoglycan editing factor PgeF [Flavobacteriales bacterium]
MNLIQDPSGIQWYQCGLIAVPHAFFLRHGGVSPSPCDALNFSGSLDVKENVMENRRRAFDALRLDLSRVAYLKQIHSTIVCDAIPGQQEGDALVTNKKGIPIAVSGADCFPVLFHDPVASVIGAAHCGWKGTINRLAEKVIIRMQDSGCKPKHIRVAIGPGISRMAYEVSPELIEQFREAGFSDHCFSVRNLDLAQCIRQNLLESGISEAHIQTLPRCTTDADFFSHRRDKGQTGRLWSVICL